MTVNLTELEIEQIRAAMHDRIREAADYARDPLKRYAPGVLDARQEICGDVLRKIGKEW